MTEEPVIRIDKFLWGVRIFKTRSQSTDACRKGAVEIGETKVKPSRPIHPGEVVDIRKDQIRYRIKVLVLTGRRVSAKEVPVFIEDLTPEEELEKLEMRKTIHTGFRSRLPGRPTKRDRRMLDRFMDNEKFSGE
jgi:ribosome-associated heat shock protein Hsp15